MSIGTASHSTCSTLSSIAILLESTRDRAYSIIVDSTLALFDFTSESCQSSQPDYTSSSELAQEEARRARLEIAAATGDTKELTQVLWESQEIGQAGDAVLKRPGDALYLSVENGRYSSTEWLLRHGACITTNAVRIAVTRQDTKTLDLLLRNGWNINMQLNLTIPSALAYVHIYRDST